MDDAALGARVIARRLLSGGAIQQNWLYEVERDGALLLLCSEAGRHMTGSTVTVDGGHSIGSL